MNNIRDVRVAKTFNEILKFNPYHDRLGRFTTGGSSNVGGVDSRGRTEEKQKKNIHVARSYATFDVTNAIRGSGHSREDKETMDQIINSSSKEKAMHIYSNSNSTVREGLQDIIEETYYGIKHDATGNTGIKGDPQKRTRSAVMATGNRWSMENFNSTHN